MGEGRLLRFLYFSVATQHYNSVGNVNIGGATFAATPARQVNKCALNTGWVKQVTSGCLSAGNVQYIGMCHTLYSVTCCQVRLYNVCRTCYITSQIIIPVLPNLWKVRHQKLLELLIRFEARQFAITLTDRRYSKITHIIVGFNLRYGVLYSIILYHLALYAPFLCVSLLSVCRCQITK